MKDKDANTDLIISHLEYIRSRVDEINGRVRDNEKSISWIKGVGVSITFLITSVLGYLIKE